MKAIFTFEKDKQSTKDYADIYFNVLIGDYEIRVCSSYYPKYRTSFFYITVEDKNSEECRIKRCAQSSRELCDLLFRDVRIAINDNPYLPYQITKVIFNEELFYVKGQNSFGEYHNLAKADEITKVIDKLFNK